MRSQPFPKNSLASLKGVRSMAFREKSINTTPAKPGYPHLNQPALKSTGSFQNRRFFYNSRPWLCKAPGFSSQTASCPEVHINYYFTKGKWVMAFCHSSQDTLQAAKHTRIPEHQNYVGRLQHVLPETRQNFHSINPQETPKRRPVEKTGYTDEIFS